MGTIQAYAGANAPQGYLLCQGQAISKSEYAELYLAIGDLYSNAETAEGFFNVPDLRDKFAQGANADNLGEVIEAGLPNITGSFGTYVSNTAAIYNRANKAFQLNSDASSYNRVAGYMDADVATNDRKGVIFDASRGETRADGLIKTETEHHVYGSSNTVQPPAVAINYIIKY